MLKRDEIDGLNIALNEATLNGIEIDANRREVGVTLSVLTLPKEGPLPDDPRILFVFAPVGRIAASLRLGHWTDPTAKVVSFEIDRLPMFVSDRNLPIYGWDFFDQEEDFKKWQDRLSVDCRWGPGDGMTRSITLFQEQSERHLDLRIWFNALNLQDPRGQPISIAEVIAGGQRWWDGLYAGDPRTKNAGIYPLK